ncbi:MAG: HK97 family phage prohead protease [Clostridiales bacterium]|nr:HK97 family phage prohead protease [Clostridiales bacterium]
MVIFKMEYDFCGWATRNNLKCSDGRTIRENAFKDNDGEVVPLVWNHRHNEPQNVLGHAKLENRAQGVYAYCKFNDTEMGQNAKELVKHKDVTALSIYANRLKEKGGNVFHGVIREVSLVLAGANPGAYIDAVLTHGEDTIDGAIIYTGEEIALQHSDSQSDDEEKKETETMSQQFNPQQTDAQTPNDKTIQDVFDELTDEQKEVVYFLIGKAMEDSEQMPEDDEYDDYADYEDEEDAENMKHNVFDNDDFYIGDELSHAEMESIIEDGKRYGSLKEAVLAHGIENIDYMFPDAQAITDNPDFITRNMDWVTKVLSGTHHTPFSRIKSLHANLTEDQARAKGYIKGKLKKEEVFSLLKRTTDPTTIYKKQKLDRDDVVDITSFDVVAWLKTEMRLLLDEEIARAVLVGDGRLNSDDDKIKEDHIRPIWTDAELYSINSLYTENATDAAKDAKEFIKTALRSRKDYKGTGNPTLFISEELLTECLLLEDNMGRPLYDTVEKLATTMRVKEIVSVPVMDGLTRQVKGVDRKLRGIIVNLNDYNIGADKGGAVNMFEDFDIDYNAQKYLIETRCSGALVKPYSAIVVESIKGTTPASQS